MLVVCGIVAAVCIGCWWWKKRRPANRASARDARDQDRLTALLGKFGLGPAQPSPAVSAPPASAVAMAPAPAPAVAGMGMGGIQLRALPPPQQQMNPFLPDYVHPQMLARKILACMYYHHNLHFAK